MLEHSVIGEVLLLQGVIKMLEEMLVNQRVKGLVSMSDKAELHSPAPPVFVFYLIFFFMLCVVRHITEGPFY